MTKAPLSHLVILSPIISSGKRGGDLGLFRAASQLKEDILKAFAGAPGPQLVHSAGGDHLAAADDRDPVAHALGDLKNVGRHENGGAALGDFAQNIFDQPGAAWVEPD